MNTEGFIERATKIAGDLEFNLKRVSENQINKVELDFNKHNVAFVVKIKNSGNKEVATIKVGNSTITPRVSSLEQTTVNIKGVQSLSISLKISSFAEAMHWCWKNYGEDKEVLLNDNE